MLTWMDMINMSMAVSGLIVAVLSIYFVRNVPLLESWNRRYFECFFSLIGLYILSDTISQISLSFMGESFAILSGTAVFMESLFSSLLMLLLNIYLLHTAGENWHRSHWFYAAVVLWAVYFAFLIDTQFTGVFYGFTRDNVYRRGPLYPLLLVPPVLLMVYNIFILFSRRDRISAKVRRALLINLCIPLISMVIQMLFYGLLMILIGVSVGALLLFVFTLNENIHQNINMMKREANQKARIAVLQMRPHFIYNTLSSIYYLCGENPQKAMGAIVDFSTYLRRNFTAIASEDSIPFRDELDHVKAYLNVEKTRFEDSIFAKYSIQVIEFRVPPLSVQPLVENAVKHGLDPEEAPLRITITSRETEEGFEVIVEDTGSGFDETQDAMDEGGNHIAIDNIRRRLDMICQGSLVISSRKGEGTKATIRIPRQKQIES